MISENINKIYRQWVKDNFAKEKCDKLLGFEIKIEIVPSPDFVKELEKMDKISLLRVSVDKENLTQDEDIAYGEENVLRKNVDVWYRPIKGLSFSKSKVIKYFENFNNPTKKEKISRIVIGGRADGNPISLDTERMKLSKYIETELSVDGLVNSEDIFKNYNKLLNVEFKEYFNNIFLEIEESEE
ncbi:hypothetical protein B0P06_004703 [Clostridium saccharoperbutylacetonicum]|uniref:Uncharacterized protein n=1 Tax=Clostridium saccharoperbutylacetonicum N1-4(HMT) TaxID=931276 RepID=M1N0A3_9CLOT|nr:hypothetical protein [Clostridium saccharoperbutylacetonicum]AGF57012.1 hypothetical protein Cspa_c32510 [Clostridium saccharoperbutylacetonicum N1-4(HMT)]NRT62229.1 hypothetical protein [Clostridium saccharoperbutylacetonicum]NSB25562.1 hypothetical protein [Clostridium saccharoperbutylacetonicum]NSB44932.1 hypothetical protein [Clostridium saccharoperbutylacetonicum]